MTDDKINILLIEDEDPHEELIQRAFELVSVCACEDGCPSCVGPGGENGVGGKQETLAILKELNLEAKI